MSAPNFIVKAHTLPTTHIRHYSRSITTDTAALRIALKQYTPLSNPIPRDGDITIIAAHANGVAKEMYEALWDDLLAESLRSQEGGRGWRIRGIWIAEVWFQGASGVLNEKVLGNEQSWFDHPRDLLNMINHFQDEMPPPLFGIGHSMGGNNMANLAFIHPRLLTGIVFMDPVVGKWMGKSNVALLSVFRRDVWNSREEAATSFRKNPFYKVWDPRVLDAYLEYGLRELPTDIYPEYTPTETKSAKDKAMLSAAAINAAAALIDAPVSRPVTLTTTKHQEVFAFNRAMFPEDEEPSDEALAKFKRLRRRYPDVAKEFEGSPVYRPEPALTYNNLPTLRPRALYIFPSKTNLYPLEQMGQIFNNTGTGFGGSGGPAEGAVKQVAVDGGHFVPFEKPAAVAGKIADWLAEEVPRWKEERDTDRAEWEADQKKGGGRRMSTMSPGYLKWMNWMKDRKREGKL